MSSRPAAPKWTFAPATPERWEDLAVLFGPRGACAGCWCMFWRLSRKDFDAGRGQANRRAMARLVRQGAEPGILAFAGDEPVGWCAVAPRAAYPALGRSRVLAEVDDTPVWSVSCFFVKRGWRRKGLTVRLLREAARFAAARGAKVLEGYPVEPKAGSTADTFAWTGLASAFRAAGFREVARRSPTRPIFRKPVRAGRRREKRTKAPAER